MKKLIGIVVTLVLVAGCCPKKNQKCCPATQCDQKKCELIDESLQEERVSGVMNAKEVGWSEADYQ